MRLEDEEAQRHRAVGLLQQRVFAAEEFVYRDAVAQALGHLLPVDGDHVVVHPEPRRIVAGACGALCNLALVVREQQVHPAAVDIEHVAEVFAAHSRAFDMPAGIAFAPGTAPLHDMLRIGLLPERKIVRIAFFVLAFQLARFVAGAGYKVFQHPAAQFAIVVVFRISEHVEIDAAVYCISQACFHNCLDHFDLFNDMAGGTRFDTGRKHTHQPDHFVVREGIGLGHFHWLYLLEASLLLELVFTFIHIADQVSNVRNVAHVAHLVSQVFQVAAQHIEYHRSAHMTQVRRAIHGRAADVQTHPAREQRFENLGSTRVGIVKLEVAHPTKLQALG